LQDSLRAVGKTLVYASPFSSFKFKGTKIPSSKLRRVMYRHSLSAALFYESDFTRKNNKKSMGLVSDRTSLIPSVLFLQQLKVRTGNHILNHGIRRDRFLLPLGTHLP
jgi:hypothetical protein